MKKRVALVDFRLTGHHALWLATYASSFLECNCEVDIFTSSVEECSDKIKALLPSLDLSSLRIFVTESAGMTSRILGCRSYFRLQKLHKDLTARENEDCSAYDLVYFPYIDDIAQRDLIFPYFLGHPFPRVFAGLLMEPRTRVLEQKSGVFRKIEANCVTRADAKIIEILSLIHI